ncbi:MAG: hypothetical protein WBD16_12390 [Pyrinomonadaceae bacterium]
MIRHVLLIAGLIIFLTTFALGSNPCEKLLSLGIPSIEQTESSGEKHLAIVRSFKQFTSYEEARSSSFGVTLISLMEYFGLSLDEEGYKKFVKIVEKYESLTAVDKEKFKSFTQKASVEIADAFVKCITSPGKAFAWVEGGSTGNRFVVAVRYNPLADKPWLEPIVHLSPKNLNCNSSALLPRIGDATKRMSCQIPKDVAPTAVEVVLNAKNNIEIVGARLIPPQVLAMPINSGEVTCGIDFDIILCSGPNCALTHILAGRDTGEWQIVQWFESQAETEKQGAQVGLPSKFSGCLFGKEPILTSADDWVKKEVSFSYEIVDNKPDRKFFDLDGFLSKQQVRWSNGGRFMIANNFEKEPGHHIRIRVRAHSKFAK